MLLNKNDRRFQKFSTTRPGKAPTEAIIDIRRYPTWSFYRDFNGKNHSRKPLPVWILENNKLQTMVRHKPKDEVLDLLGRQAIVFRVNTWQVESNLV